jgi:CheY-like chemotaxis protein
MINGSLSDVSILCIDNHIDSLELLKLVLELEGAQVFTAISMEDALRVLGTRRPDILISDLAMPNGDGISLLESIRSRKSEVKAIALTGISDSKVRQRALDAGFDDYLVKPVDDHVLIETVSGLAKKRKKRCA